MDKGRKPLNGTENMHVLNHIDGLVAQGVLTAHAIPPLLTNLEVQLSYLGIPIGWEEGSLAGSCSREKHPVPWTTRPR